MKQTGLYMRDFTSGRHADLSEQTAIEVIDTAAENPELPDIIGITMNTLNATHETIDTTLFTHVRKD